MSLLKKYWDILGGFATGMAISLLARFELGKIQLVYSIIILILVSIGVLKIVKQAVEKNKGKAKKRKDKNIIDAMVDGQKPVKAVNLASNPTRDGERLGEALIETMRGLKKKMTKLKTWFDKFKGYMLTIALGILTIMEMCGSFINDLCDDKLQVHGLNIVPVVTLGAALIVGMLSNGFTKDQWAKIKTLFTKSTTDELVTQEIKKEIKDDEQKLAQHNKILATKETELDNLNTELTNAKNTYEAKQKMFNMVPQLATEETVQNAANTVVNVEARIETKKAEIAETNATIVNLNKTIAALKSQL